MRDIHSDARRHMRDWSPVVGDRRRHVCASMAMNHRGGGRNRARIIRHLQRQFVPDKRTS